MLALLATGLGLRAIDIADRPLAVDEAESAINALSILEHGYPTDAYMGRPIYENTLTVPWPESSEYEFRDSSYTARGFAVYHGWLPLYAIAAGLKLAGIEPDPSTEELRARHSAKELGRRMLAPRLPSLAFSALFMLATFGFGRAVGGRAGGWTALLLASCTEATVQLGSAARYYSANLAFSTIAGWTLWRLLQHGRLRDHLAHGLAMTLLFHTHVLSCVVLGLVSLGTLPLLLRRRGFTKRAVACGTVFLLGTLPWMLTTGFPGEANKLPRAFQSMQLPGDLIRLSGQPLSQLVPLALAGCWVILSFALSDSLPERMRRPLRAHHRALGLFVAWGLLAFLVFSFLIPLNSYFPGRVSMMLVVPKLMFVSTLIVAVLQEGFGVRRAWVAPVAAIALLVANGSAAIPRDRHDRALSPLPFLADYFETHEFEPQARLYTEPNQQLVLAYTLGLPIQSIAPVRKSFLDSYPGEIVFLAFPDFGPRWDAARVQAVLAETGPDKGPEGLPLSEAEALAIARELRVAKVRERIEAAGATLLGPGPVPIPVPVAAARARELETLPDGWWTDIPAFAGFDVRDEDLAWKVFFYRFVDPVARSGEGANYADRLKGSTAVILWQAGMIVYRAPPRPDRTDER